MEGVLLNPVEHWWRCPSCDVVSRTVRSDPHTEMHNCNGMNGLSVPLVEVRNADDKPHAQHILNEREDYIGDRKSVV